MFSRKNKINLDIRTRLVFQFTLIVAAIIILLSISVYYFSASYRESSFYARLKDRAMTTGRLLIEVNEVDTTLLKIIDRNTINAFYDEKIVVYNHLNKEIYSSIDENTISVSKELLDNIRAQKEIRYHLGNNEVIGFIYSDRYNPYILIASASDQHGLRKLSNLKTILITGFFFSMILSIFAGWFYAGRALKPMKDVVTQVDKITISNLDLRVQEGNGTDEIAQLAITFNRMLERLEGAFEMQRGFVSNASHELRTPLTAITGQIEVSLMKKRSEQEYEAILQSVLEDIKNLGRLSNNLLDLAKASSDISEIKLKELRVDELLWQAYAELKKHNPEYNIRIIFDQDIDDEKKLIIFGNEHLIRSALINVMDNACKFSGNKSADTFLAVEGNRVKLKFSDEGIGIDKNEQDQVFQPFYRASNARNISGHGLGLSLTKKIIEIHKGEISIKSVLTKGTVISISFPFLISKS